MTHLHKLEVYVLDLNNDSPVDEIISELESNDYFFVNVKHSETANIGKWHDEHELNSTKATAEDYRKYFK